MDLAGLTDHAIAQLLAPYSNILDPRNVFSFIGALLFLFGVAALARLRRGTRAPRLEALARLVLKRRVWMHPSSILDYKIYATVIPMQAFALGFFIVGTDFWSRHTGTLLTWLLGPAAATSEISAVVIAVIILTQICAFDFGYWLGHFIMHKSPVLWEFHKVHHSALVMTPATEYRQHPLEMILIPCVMGLTTGITYAVTTWWLGEGAPFMGAFAYNLIILAHIFSFHHLRHSHINMAFTGIWGVLLHSPAHHQLHHSSNPDHFDRNMGYLLSVWDWLAGTFVMPVKGQQLTLGIGPEGAEHDSLKAVMIDPFRKAWRVAREDTARPSPNPLPAAGEGFSGSA